MKTRILITLVSLLLLTTTGLTPQSTRDLKATQQYLQSLGIKYNLKSLQTLDLAWTKVSDKGLVHLKALPGCRINH